MAYATRARSKQRALALTFAALAARNVLVSVVAWRMQAGTLRNYLPTKNEKKQAGKTGLQDWEKLTWPISGVHSPDSALFEKAAVAWLLGQQQCSRATQSSSLHLLWEEGRKESQAGRKIFSALSMPALLPSYLSSTPLGKGLCGDVWQLLYCGRRRGYSWRSVIFSEGTCYFADGYHLHAHLVDCLLCFCPASTAKHRHCARCHAM